MSVFKSGRIWGVRAWVGANVYIYIGRDVAWELHQKELYDIVTATMYERRTRICGLL